jgi:cell division protein YceG involved in septum cleavage
VAEAAPPSTPSPKGARRRRTKRVRREPTTLWSKFRGTLTVVALVCGFVIAGGATYLLVVYPASAGPGAGRDVELTFAPGQSLGDVVANLEGAGLVASPRTFAIYARLMALTAAPGTHLLTDDVSPGAAVSAMRRA